MRTSQFHLQMTRVVPLAGRSASRSLARWAGGKAHQSTHTLNWTFCAWAFLVQRPHEMFSSLKPFRVIINLRSPDNNRCALGCAGQSGTCQCLDCRCFWIISTIIRLTRDDKVATVLFSPWFCFVLLEYIEIGCLARLAL